jgi:phosphatidate cytidylyltransferase
MKWVLIIEIWYKPSTLLTRILSALVIAPPALAAVHFGVPCLQAMVLLVPGLAAWEWARVSGDGKLGGSGRLLVGFVVLALAAGMMAMYLLAATLLIGGALTVGLWAGPRGRKCALWSAAGVVYLPLTCFAFVWLRLVPEDGAIVIYWLLATVWATDTGAYVIGRAVGGPKLAPAISPNKTWAGLAGGIVAAAAVGLVAAALWEGAEAWALAAAGSGLAIIGHAGDLLISYWKRRFGVKDASHLIPGHGGVLDRVDSLLAVSLVVGAYYRIAIL